MICPLLPKNRPKSDYEQLSLVLNALNQSPTPLKIAEALTPLFMETLGVNSPPLDPEHLRFAQASALLAATELEEKTHSLWFTLFADKHEKAAVKQTIKFLKVEIPASNDEDTLFLSVLSDMRKNKGAKAALSEDEYKALRLISHSIYEKLGPEGAEEYKKVMTSIYEGEHVLIEDGSELCEELKKIPGTEVRLSSHYDYHVTPQYHLAGEQIHELLFGKVTLALNRETNEPFFSKTAKEIQKLSERNPSKYPIAPGRTKTYTWFQMEGSPLSFNIFHINFWRHNVRDFVRYAFFRIFGFEKPNVGPYGFGHADNHPTVIAANRHFQREGG